MQNNIIATAIQFTPEHLEPTKNLASVLQLTFEAANLGAKLIVLPELCLAGGCVKNKNDAIICAQDKFGYQSESFIAITKQFNCHVVFGYIELCDGELYNSAALIGSNGLEANFQKHNLDGIDNLWAKSSEQFMITSPTFAGRTGVLIGRDIINNYRKSYAFYKQGQKFYKKGDIDTICVLSNQSNVTEFPDSSWFELAEETDSNVVVSSRIEKQNNCAIINRKQQIWLNKNSDSEIIGGLIVL